MRATTSTGARRLRVQQVDLPAPGPGQVVIDVTACGICGSNLHEWRHPDQSIAAGGVVVPGISGHEVAGVVVDAGDDVGAAAGARVVLEPNLAQACGTCEVCARGDAWFCRQRWQVPVWGFADRMLVRQAGVFEVPDGVDDATATLVEPLACAIHGLRGTARAIAGGDDLGGATVAVVGAGVAGLLALRAAAHLGAGRLVSVARYPHQGDAATRLGADVVIDSRDDTQLDQLKDERPEVVVEAVGGTADTFDTAIHAVRPAGEIVVLGLFDQPQAIDVRRAIFRELRLSFPVTYGRRGDAHDYDHALAALVDGGDAVRSLVTHRFGLDDVDAAFRRADDKGGDVLRVVVTP